MPDPSGLPASLPTFPIWGTIIWLTPEQGGRRSGPPPTPWDTYYFATAYVPPHRREDTLASVVIDVSVRNAWQSHAKLRWLADPHPAVGRGSCIFITEGPEAVAIFTVEHVEDPGAHRHPPLSAQHLAEIVNRHRAATPGPWTSMVEGRDHESAHTFLMTGTSNHRGPDIHLSWDPAIDEHHRRADQDFIAHARQDIPDMVAELQRLRGLLDLMPHDLVESAGAAEPFPGEASVAATAHVVQAETEQGLIQLGGFTSIHEAVKAMDLAQSEEPSHDWVINMVPLYRRAQDSRADG